MPVSPALYRAGAGEPVLLLHGFTGTWHHWRPVLADLVARHEVVAPTLAGHCGGPAWPRGVALSLCAAGDALEAQLDSLGVREAHIVGNSMGGALALELARRGRARSVVALSPGGGWDLAGPEAARIARFFARQLRVTRAAASHLPRLMARSTSRRAALRDIMRRGHLVTPADALDLALTSLECTVAEDVLRALRCGSLDVVPQGLDEIEVPVLLAWAEHDRVLPRASCSSRLRAALPGAEFRVLPGVGHVPMWDDPRLVVDTVVGWVRRVEAGEVVGAGAGA